MRQVRVMTPLGWKLEPVLLCWIATLHVVRSTEVRNCMWAVNSACEIVASNIDQRSITTCKTAKPRNNTLYDEKLTELESKLALLENKTSQVYCAFYAAITVSYKELRDTDVNPPVFEDVKINVGSAFNPATGIFTAPVDGLFFFVYEIVMTTSNGDIYIKHKRGSTEIASYKKDGGNDDYGSLTVSCALELEVDDEVYCKGGDTVDGSIRMAESSSFMGFLIKHY